MNRLLSTLRGAASRLHSMTRRMPSRSDSSRMSAMPSIFLLLDEVRDLLGEAGLVDLVGQLGDDDRHASAGASPRTRLRPASPRGRGRGRTSRGSRRSRSRWPVSGLRRSSKRKIVAPVGKSGPIDVVAQLVVGQVRVRRSARSWRRRSRPGGAAGCWWPCRRRCRTSR